MSTIAEILRSKGQVILGESSKYSQVTWEQSPVTCPYCGSTDSEDNPVSVRVKRTGNVRACEKCHYIDSFMPVFIP